MGLPGRYRRDQWEDLAWNEVAYARGTWAWIFHDGERIGGIEYTEYRLSMFATDDEIFDALDGISTRAARLTVRAVSGRKPGASGTLVGNVCS